MSVDAFGSCELLRVKLWRNPRERGVARLVLPAGGHGVLFCEARRRSER